MVRCKSIPDLQRDILIDQALLGIKSGKYKSVFEVEKQLELSKSSVTCRVNWGISRSQARQKQQKLSGIQENILLK